MICAEPCVAELLECVQHPQPQELPWLAHVRWSTCAAPVRFDPKDPHWEGAFDRVWFTGSPSQRHEAIIFGTAAIAWMSYRPWFWEPFRLAIVAITSHVREVHGVECQCELAVEELVWRGEAMDVTLYVDAQAFPYGQRRTHPCFVAEQAIENLPAVQNIIDREHRSPWGVNNVGVQLGVKEMPTKPSHTSAEDIEHWLA